MLSTCSALQGPPSPDLFEKQIALSLLLKKHRLPTTSNQAARHVDPEINMAVAHVRKVSLSQGLVFDGSKVTEGIVVVGRHSGANSMLVGLQFYRVPDGRIAFTDVTHSSGNNFTEAMAMKSRLLRAL
jgi:hypothetical protein